MATSSTQHAQDGDATAAAAKVLASRKVWDSADGTHIELRYGWAALQGNKTTMDSELIAVPLDECSVFFGIFDGRGGREVATYVKNKLPNELAKHNRYKEAIEQFQSGPTNDYLPLKVAEATTDAYLNVDSDMATPEGVDELCALLEDETDHRLNLAQEDRYLSFRRSTEISWLGSSRENSITDVDSEHAGKRTHNRRALPNGKEACKPKADP